MSHAMAFHTSSCIISCKVALLLFAFAALSAHTFLPTAAAPVPPTEEAQNPGRNLFLGMRAAFFYTENLNVDQTIPITTSNEHQEIGDVIGKVCHLLIYYEMLESEAEMGNENLKNILRQNLVDGCEWIKALNSSGLVSIEASSTPVQQQNGSSTANGSSCSPDETNFLHAHCMRTVVKDVAGQVFGYLQTRGITNITPCTIRDWVERSVPEDQQRAVIATIPNASNCP